MRICISHQTTYEYETPAKGAVQIVRLTPRDHEGQHVLHWRLDLSGDLQLDRSEDAMGNITHSFSVDGPITRLQIGVEGEVETTDMNGMIRGTVEPLPQALFMRETALTRADAAIRALAHEATSRTTAQSLGMLHWLQETLNQRVVYDTEATTSQSTAAEALARGRGVCQDYAHIFISAARLLGVPARYVGGHLLRSDGRVDQEAGHAWAEAYLENLGWVGFDPSNGICVTDAYVRISVGLDGLGAAPIRGTVFGGRGESLSVAVRVRESQKQSPTQSQTQTQS